MIFIPRQEPFTCDHCGKNVEPLRRGTYRDHCPYCLYSKHVDDSGPGDRKSLCLGLFIPIGIHQHTKKGFVVEYACERCGKKVKNKAAEDDELANFFERKLII